MDARSLPQAAFLLRALRSSAFPADIFSFTESLTAPTRHHSFAVEWDNAAVIPIVSYADW
jgi:hypothetical protein